MGRPPHSSRLARRALTFALLGLLLVAVAIGSLFAGAYVGVARTLPSLDLVDRIASPQTTKIYDASPTPALLAEIQGLQNRGVLSAEQIPQAACDAVVAIEDPRFYEHKGMDFFAIARAAWANMRHRTVPAGGSPITQQLIKNGFIAQDRSSGQATLEPALAYELESHWTKEKILDEYLNVVYFGSGAYGIQAAARSYFGVDAKDLSLAQAALLAGLPRAPSACSPRRDPAAALARRDQVLNTMYQQRYITSDELQQALAAPLELAGAGSDDGVKEPYWVELVREQLVAHYGSSTVLSGGLRVYTSLVPSAQQAAETAITTALGQPGQAAGSSSDGQAEPLSAALVAIDVHTGQLVAMVGGSDPTAQPQNLATQSRFGAGATFMPFALTAALEQGISPDATYDSDAGPLSLTQALADSSTSVFVRLATDLGATTVATTAAGLGITSAQGDPPSPALASSGPDAGVTPLEMAMAYATLASGGERLTPRVIFDPSKTGYPVSIVKVTDSTGRLLDDNGVAGTRAVDRGLAELVTSSLRSVTATAAAQAADIGRPVAGKTGTSTDGRGAWFVGYTPELVAVVWVGYAGEPAGGAAARAGAASDEGGSLAGTSLPAQIWGAFMKSALAGAPASDFSTTDAAQWVSMGVCSESHLLPTSLCPTVVKRLFRLGEAPTDTCDIHVPQAVFMPNVVGMSLTKAKKLLSDAHLTVQTVSDSGSLKPAGTVTKQDFAADKPILQGTTVTLHVSAGQATMVPKLAGHTLEEAQALLATAGLTADFTSQSSDTVAANVVISQEPGSGSVVGKGSTVHFVVSSGPATPPST